jgi:hypothetical protein
MMLVDEVVVAGVSVDEVVVVGRRKRKDKERNSTHHAATLPCDSQRGQHRVKIASDDVSMACDRHVKTTGDAKYTVRRR